jgi:hypothetical protein
MLHFQLAWGADLPKFHFGSRNGLNSKLLLKVRSKLEDNVKAQSSGATVVFDHKLFQKKFDQNP